MATQLSRKSFLAFQATVVVQGRIHDFAIINIASTEIGENLIKRRLPLEKYARLFMRLKSESIRNKGCCPFHGEKTPSFSITPQRKLYHCFGWGKSGDIPIFIKCFYSVVCYEAKKIAVVYLFIGSPSRQRAQKLSFYSGRITPPKQIVIGK